MTDFDFKRPQKATLSPVKPIDGVVTNPTPHVSTESIQDISTPPTNTISHSNVEPVQTISTQDSNVSEIHVATDSYDKPAIHSQEELHQNHQETPLVKEENTKSPSHLHFRKDSQTQNEKEKKHSKLLSIILLIGVILILLLTLGFGIYLAQDRLAFWDTDNSANTEEISSVGTFVAFEEGTVEEDIIDDENPIYTNELFPDFELTTNVGTKWKITESDKSRGELVKYDVIAKNGDLNVVFSFYTDNGGLTQDSICMRESDVTVVDANWAIEKRYNEVYKEHIGYYIMPVKSYINKTDPNFDATFNEYTKFINNYTDTPLSRDEVGYCSTAQRVFKTNTTIAQTQAKNSDGDVLVRVFTPKPDLSEQELTLFTDLVKTIKY